MNSIVPIFLTAMKPIRFKNLLLILFTVGAAYLGGQNLSWIKHYQGNSSVQVRSIEFDTAGFIYIGGVFRDTFFYDPNDLSKWTVSERRNSFNMSFDNFIQKLDDNGNVIWTRWFGNRQDDNLQGIKVSARGHLYIYGIFQETLDFDLDTSVYEMASAGSGDAFMAKYDLDGGIIWAKSFKGPSTLGTYGLDVDENDNIYVTGFHIGLANFNTDSSGTDTFTSKSFHDMFVAKLNDSGKLVWVHSYGSAQGQFVRHAGNSISYDGMGGVWVCGKFRDSLIINKPGQRVLVHSRADDGLVFKYDTSGNLLHAKVIYTSTGDGTTRQIITDQQGNAYICGYGRGDIDYDTIRVGDRYGNQDPFLIKIDSASNYLWGLNISNTRNSMALGIALNTEGINMVGFFTTDSIQVDPIGSGKFLQPVTNNNNAFFLTYDPGNGELRNAMVYGAAGESRPNDIKTRGDNMMIGGIFSVSGDFNPGQGVDSLFSRRNTTDGFLQYFNNCPSSFLTFDTMACDSFFWTVDSTWYFSNTNKTIKEVNSKGCDSIITLRLRVGQNSFASDTVVACDSFTWINGKTYFESTDTAMHSIPNQSGCDSIISLHLTLNYSSSITDSVVACDSFTWINGITYFANNDTTQYIIPNKSGCDSVISLYLRIIEMDTEVIIENNTLVSVDSHTTTHQWLDCELGFGIIEGATNFRFEPQEKGQFAVELSREHCIDTSLCIPFEPSQVRIPGKKSEFIQIFPNPTTGKVWVQTHGIEGGEVKIYDMYGKFSATYLLDSNLEINLPSSSGVYILCINTPDGTLYKRVIKAH